MPHESHVAVMSLVVFAASAILASGCGCDRSRDSGGGGGGAGQSSQFGKFDPPVADVQLLTDGRKAKLLKSFRFTDASGKPWEAPAGTEIDGASIPQVFWTIIGGPYEGKYRFGSIVHDRYCVDHGGRAWRDVHRMFYNACLAGGTDPQTAKLMYAAVYHFGPRWSEEEKGVDELAELIPTERARVAEVLEASVPPAEPAAPATRPGPEAARRLRAAAVPTEQQYRAAVLAPRRTPVTPAPGPLRVNISPTLAKWDRIRDVVRQNPDVGLEELEQAQ
jgi:hypothetical protein